MATRHWKQAHFRCRKSFDAAVKTLYYYAFYYLPVSIIYSLFSAHYSSTYLFVSLKKKQQQQKPKLKR